MKKQHKILSLIPFGRNLTDGFKFSSSLWDICATSAIIKLAYRTTSWQRRLKSYSVKKSDLTSIPVEGPTELKTAENSFVLL